MTAYAMFVTFVLGGCTFFIILYSYLAWNDGKALKHIELDEQKRHEAWRSQVKARLRKDDEDMDAAVALVTDTLGGTILHYEK